MIKADAELESGLLESGCEEPCIGAPSPDAAVSSRSTVTWVATLLLVTLTLCILGMQSQAPATYLAAPFMGNEWEDVATHNSLYIEVVGNVGDVYCNINGSVEPVAIIDGKMFDGDDIPVTWPGECAMVTVSAEWTTELHNRDGVDEIVLLSKEKNAEYDIYTDLQTLAASQAALKGDISKANQWQQQIFLQITTYLREHKEGSVTVADLTEALSQTDGSWPNAYDVHENIYQYAGTNWKVVEATKNPDDAEGENDDWLRMNSSGRVILLEKQVD